MNDRSGSRGGVLTLNPITFAQEVNRQFLRYQLTAFPLSDPDLSDQARRMLAGAADESRLVKGPYVSLARSYAEGASLDAPLHQLVYRQQPRAAGVLHSHGPYSVAMSFAGEDFRPIDFEGQYYFARVPVISISFEEYVEKAPEAVAAALADDPIAMVRGHGVYAWGETLNRAYKWTCSLELSAKTYVIARQAAAL